MQNFVFGVSVVFFFAVLFAYAIALGRMLLEDWRKRELTTHRAQNHFGRWIK